MRQAVRRARSGLGTRVRRRREKARERRPLRRARSPSRLGSLARVFPDDPSRAADPDRIAQCQATAIPSGRKPNPAEPAIVDRRTGAAVPILGGTVDTLSLAARRSATQAIRVAGVAGATSAVSSIGRSRPAI